MEAKSAQKSMSDFIVKTIAYTLLGVFSVMAFFSMLFTVAMPKSAAKYYQWLGMQKAEAFCYETEYSRTQKIEDLYNVIMVHISAGNASQALQYIQTMQNREDYMQFSKTLDVSAIAVTDVSKVAYTASVQSYFAKKEIQYTYQLKGLKQAQQLAVNSLTNTQVVPYFYAVTAFIDCVYKDVTLSLDKVYTQFVSFAEQKIDGEKIYDIVMRQAQEAKQIADDLLAQGTEEGVNTYKKAQAIYLYKSLELYRATYMLAFAQYENATSATIDHWNNQKQQLAQCMQQVQQAYNTCIQG